MTISIGSILVIEGSEGTVGRRFKVARIKYMDTNYAYPDLSRISYELELVTVE